MRSPLPAWRKLFAIGGAPAASHVSLSRAPSTERLFEPFARTRIAHAASLDALVRPLEVGELLARVTNAALAPATVADATAEAVQRVRRREALASGPVSPALGPNLESEWSHPGAATRRRHEPRVDVADRHRRALPQVTPESVQRRLVEPTPTTASPREIVTPSALAAARPRMAAERPVAVTKNAAGSPVGSNTGLEARLGSLARVVLDEPVPNVERLLAVGAPAPKAQRQPGSPTERKRAAATSKSSSPEVARLLASAIDRASISTASMTPSPSEAPRAFASKPQLPSPSPEPRRSSLAEQSSDVGGFRGLALRTLQPTNGRHVHVQHIEPETRTSSDLALDTLDDKVADSLARVLEREARRHGIDLAEARS